MFQCNNMYEYYLKLTLFYLKVSYLRSVWRKQFLGWHVETVEGFCGIDVVSGSYFGGDGRSDLCGMDGATLVGVTASGEIRMQVW